MNGFLIVLIPALPLAAFLINGLFGRWLGRLGGWIAVACMGGSAAISIPLFIRAMWGGFTPFNVTLWRWMSNGAIDITIGFRVDQLTCLMLLYVTCVSFMVFLYSMGYMAGDPGFNRFFSFLGLFDFSMLVLVLGDSLPVVFIGWEGVGLCSYLLIGYYMDLPGAPDAGKKAFIVNRIGDFGFLVGMMMLFAALGTLDIQKIILAAEQGAAGVGPLAYGGAFVTVVTLALFLGCTGKSAQIPLFTWLPDAMAGPTPVSALIHAATMVTAGVYLVVRMSGLFVLAPATMTVIAGVAAATAFVAGSIALTQQDIKKVLAYSTVSQLGFMFLACGVGAFGAGIFHVFTHSFFKACLFLGAGSVIHAAHAQDLDHLGGLRKYMPVTAWTFCIACASIAGLPLLAGFVSKDEILWSVFASGAPGSMLLWIIAVITALMTAVYSFRAYFMTFEGTGRLSHDKQHHAHESPWTMTVPLVLLAFGAIVAGALNLPGVFGEGTWRGVNNLLEPVLEPARKVAEAHAHEMHSPSLELALMALSGVIAIAGVALAYRYTLAKWPEGARRLAKRFRLLYKISLYRWWWDDFYMKYVAGGTWGLAKLATWFDRWVIDGIMHGIAGAASLGSRFIRALQNGQAQAYVLIFLLGANIVIGLIIWFK
ncbi:NADH-quinone oxidoreductase subunit L [bacterium]|nr:NADH-quinone oxidoreductase subunit L [bacterium]